ncbi:MAG: N-acetylmuramoyl-L-alanine amidase [Clostridiales bacterium]|nr:N-acetylmuramoyl-L-alanine amidase [Clostridiales bacterium]
MSKPSKNKAKFLIPLIVFLVLLLGAGTAVGIWKKQKDREAAEQQAKLEAETTPEPTKAPTKEPTPTVTEAPEEEPELLIPEEVESLGNGKLIAIDPGHQGKGNSEHEPIGPGASQTKPKVASGTSGRTTGVPEYQLNLDVSLKLRDELENRGYEVFMIRETNEVDISNAERAQMAADAQADILVRIHANGSENSSVSGALTMAPSVNNAFVGSDLVGQCQVLSKVVIEEFCAATGANNQGVYETDTMSGLNWCTIPATIVEMGYMTNPEEDTKMQTEEYQEQMVQGIANGIDKYFAE